MRDSLFNRAKEAVSVLSNVKAYLSIPGKWIKKRLAVDVNGHPLNGGNDPRADRVCLLGAIQKATKTYCVLHHPATEAIGQACGDFEVFPFNDRASTTHADAMAAIDLAIEQQCSIVRREAKASGLDVEDKS